MRVTVLNRGTHNNRIIKKQKMDWKTFIQRIILTTILIIFSINSFSQTTLANIENVDYSVVGSKIIVTYDIINAGAEENFQIDLKFVDEQNRNVYPLSLSGDVGNTIYMGKEKRITWNVLKDRDELIGNYKAVVSIASVSKYVGGGPGYAFLSVLFPGVGDYGVKKDPRNKPFVLITLSTYGLMTYGLITRWLSTYNYDKYHKAVDQKEIDDYFDKAYKQNNQSGNALGIGFAIWAADVLWVTYKGFRNISIKKRQSQHTGLKSSLNHNYYLGYDSDGVKLKYVISF